MTATPREQREARLRGLAGRKLRHDALVRVGVGTLLAHELEARRPAMRRLLNRRRDGAVLAHLHAVGHGRRHPQHAAWKGEQQIGADRDQNQRAIVERPRPEIRLVDDEKERHRYADGEDRERAERRLDHRGAAVRSRISLTTRSADSPSISALAERVTRWRSTGSASILISSGMTKSRPSSAA